MVSEQVRSGCTAASARALPYCRTTATPMPPMPRCPLLRAAPRCRTALCFLARVALLCRIAPRALPCACPALPRALPCGRPRRCLHCPTALSPALQPTHRPMTPAARWWLPASRAPPRAADCYQTAAAHWPPIATPPAAALPAAVPPYLLPHHATLPSRAALPTAAPRRATLPTAAPRHTTALPAAEPLTYCRSLPRPAAHA
ncbi:unnamed protein product [Closterium sp. NIES-54]